MFRVSRRDLVLRAAGAYAAFGINKHVAFIGAAYAQETATQPFRKYKVGDIEVFTLLDGMRDVPLREGMIKNVTVEQIKAALRASGLPDTHSTLMFTAWAVKMGDQLALIDSGTGGHAIYALLPPSSCRPLYARWVAQYATLRAAAVLRAPVSNFTAAQLTSHIVQLVV